MVVSGSPEAPFSSKEIAMDPLLIAYKNIRDLFQKEYEDVKDLLVKLFAKEMPLGVIDKGAYGLEILSGKSIGFLLTDLKITAAEYSLLVDAFNEVKDDKNFNIVWIPILGSVAEATREEKKMFYMLSYNVPWLVCLPCMLSRDFALYVRQEWSFQRRTTLVTLDHRGKLISILSLGEKWDVYASSHPWEPMALRSFELSARDLNILWGDDESIWQWKTMDFESSEVTVAELMQRCSLVIHGKVEMSKLNPKTDYETWFILKMNSHTHGWKDLVWLTQTLHPKGEEIKHAVSLLDSPRDKWFELKTGEFCATATGEVSFSLVAFRASRIGLIVKGVILRPKLPWKG